MNQKILLVDKWNTIDYPEAEVASAKIEKIKYSKGLYMMEGVRGYDYFQVRKPIMITTLKINDEIVMVDDPLHWIGMEELAKHSVGKVCVAGLGLGLLVHHLVKNKNVTEIEVYEINADVICLIYPLLPRDSRIKIVNESFFEEPFRETHFDTIILDLWVGENGNFVICGSGERVSMLEYYMRVKFNSPNSKVFMWGAKDKTINPAVSD